MGLFQRQHTDDRDVQELQNTLERTSKESFTSLISRGSLIENIKITASQPTRVNHKLGRSWKGFLVASTEMTSSIMFNVVLSDAIKAQPETTIVIQGIGAVGATATISLWVF